MGQREQDIIDEARVTLNDIDKHRWTDKRLYKLLDDAQQEICREIPLITKKSVINTAIGQEEYKLSPTCLKVLTANSCGRSIYTVSMEELDRVNPDWEEVESTQFTHIVVNNLSQLVIRPYPKLSESATCTAIKIRYSAKPIKLGYNEMEANLGSTKEELTISDTWDYGLTQYVISKAFIDYGDESSLSRAQVAQGLYLGVVNKAAKLSRKSFSKRVLTTGYQGRVSKSKSGSGYGSSCRH